MRTLLLVLFLTIPLFTRLFFYYDARPVYQDGDQFEKTHSFMHEPRRNEFSQYFFIDGIFVSVPLYPKLFYGETLEITGVVKIVDSKNGKLKTLDDVKIVKKENSNLLITISKWLRERVEEGYIAAIPQREAGLLLGIILGVRDKIDAQFYENLREVGVLHVVAASGQNVSILAALLLISLQNVVKRRYAIFFTSGAILFYSLLSGFDPPIVRASIMGIISFGAVLMGRQTSGFLALLFTSYIMILISPSLIEDISFQLSFLATFGIITIKPFFDSLGLLRNMSLLRDDITTTLSAQITTMPILLGVFGSYSLVSLPANIMILWTVPILMIIGGVGALVSVISPLFALPFAFLSYPFLLFFTTIVDVFAQFSYSLELDSLPQTLIFGYYLILFAIVLAMKKQEGRKF